ncbi:MAG: rRNA maturation RNase YbeY [Bacteroidales bacterium]|nr:rRNA maturation RNase YbeY [Bacteroidales bacterium]
MIHFEVEDASFNLRRKIAIKNWIKEILSTKSLSVGEINVVFCSDDYLLNINRQFLGHDYYTDIITFDTSEYNPVESNKRGRISADIFISLDTVLANADTYDTTFNRELYRVIIHGILHCMGYDDHSPQDFEKMKALEEEALSLLEQLCGDDIFSSQTYTSGK